MAEYPLPIEYLLAGSGRYLESSWSFLGIGVQSYLFSGHEGHIPLCDLFFSIERSNHLPDHPGKPGILALMDLNGYQIRILLQVD